MKNRSWLLSAVILFGALVLVAGFYAFSRWQQSRPSTPVGQLSVSVTAGEVSREVDPYTVCPLDEQCDGGQPPTIPLEGADEVTLDVPSEVAQSSWRLLSIYDDPAANGEEVFPSGEATTATVPAVKGEAHLVVVEVSTLAVDTDAAGEETPVVATWSVGFEPGA
ncbi:DUF2771 domain-containing protein [Corynebacterium liangguodongii]|uniref:DUF2771 domain-containing protein n=1 Tax=Corynebacterium liangguodongii TaxID=2079535 RepID=A0A2S0WCY0_9CORY|nr:DUF2771 domain-containing protein [Corynebacterium liangguodongii]AWB83616.1 DUF2771 domain-containing protein [Corynebacterium liangguodongii]PWB99576.1 DUF2771 domain-containing protein [Corynebacterium liangguodongii]